MFIIAILAIVLEPWNTRICIRIDIGAIFWIVVKIKQKDHGSAFITGGSQKCLGAIPSFIKILINRNIVQFKGVKNIVADRRITDAKAWIKKYFIAASFSWFCLFCRIKGIKEYKLSSRPIQIDIQLFDVSVIIRPSNKVNENNIEYGFERNCIKIRKESNFPCFGLENLTVPEYF